MHNLKTLALLAAALLASGAAAVAQEKPTADPPERVVPFLGINRLPLGDVVPTLTKRTGVLVLADQSVAHLPVTVGGGPLEKLLQGIVDSHLPKGAIVKKVWIPASGAGAPAPDASKVAALAAAQEALLPAGAPGEVLIQGKLLPFDKAVPVIAALDLKPVYLFTLSGAPEDPVAKLQAAQAEAMKTWLSLTPEQQKAATERQLDQLMNMDPALRQQIFAQQRQAAQSMMQRIQQMPEDQRRQFFMELTGGRFDGTPRQPDGGNPPQP